MSEKCSRLPSIPPTDQSNPFTTSTTILFFQYLKDMAMVEDNLGWARMPKLVKGMGKKVLDPVKGL